MNYYDELYHHGILGMKWGIRRYQNKDGTLTPLGRKRYGEEGHYVYKSRTTKRYNRLAAKAEKSGNIEKAQKYGNRAKRSSEIDARLQKMVMDTKASTIVKDYIFTAGLFLDPYQHLRAADVEKGKAFVLALIGGERAASVATKRYIKQDERKKK